MRKIYMNNEDLKVGTSMIETSKKETSEKEYYEKKYFEDLGLLMENIYKKEGLGEILFKLIGNLPKLDILLIDKSIRESIVMDLIKQGVEFEKIFKISIILDVYSRDKLDLLIEKYAENGKALDALEVAQKRSETSKNLPFLTKKEISLLNKIFEDSK